MMSGFESDIQKIIETYKNLGGNLQLINDRTVSNKPDFSEFQCPNCGAGRTTLDRCPYCGTIFSGTACNETSINDDEITYQVFTEGAWLDFLKSK